MRQRDFRCGSPRASVRILPGLIDILDHPLRRLLIIQSTRSPRALYKIALRAWAGLTFSPRLAAARLCEGSLPSVGDLQQPVLGTIAASRSSITLVARSRLEHTLARTYSLGVFDSLDALPRVEKVAGGHNARAARATSIGLYNFCS